MRCPLRRKFGNVGVEPWRHAPDCAQRHYLLGWLRQEQNQYLAWWPEIAKDFDQDLTDLLGYSFVIASFPKDVVPGIETAITGQCVRWSRSTEPGS